MGQKSSEEEVLVNNSHTAPGHPRHTAGVLHGGTIAAPDPHATRIINSTMVAPTSFSMHDSATRQSVFLATNAISGPIQ